MIKKYFYIIIINLIFSVRLTYGQSYTNTSIGRYCSSIVNYEYSIANERETRHILDNYFKTEVDKLPVSKIRVIRSDFYKCRSYYKKLGDGPITTYRMMISSAINNINWILNVSENIEKTKERKIAVSTKKSENAIKIADIPKCQSNIVLKSLKRAINSISYYYYFSGKILGIAGYSDISTYKIPGYRVCSVNVLFDNGSKKVIYKLRWFNESRKLLDLTVVKK